MEISAGKCNVVLLLLLTYATISSAISDPTASGNTLHVISLVPEDSEVPAIPLHLASPYTELKANNSLLCVRGLHAFYSSHWFGNDSSASLLKLMISPTAHEEECLGESQSNVLVPQIKSHRFLGHWDFLQPSFQLFEDANFTGNTVLNWTETEGNNMILFPEEVTLGSVVITGKQFKYVLSADGDVMNPKNSICLDVSKIRGPGIFYLGSAKQNSEGNVRIDIDNQTTLTSTREPIIWPTRIKAILRIPGKSTDFHVCNLYVTVSTDTKQLSGVNDTNDEENNDNFEVLTSSSKSSYSSDDDTNGEVYSVRGFTDVLSKLFLLPIRVLNMLKDLLNSGSTTLMSVLRRFSPTKVTAEAMTKHNLSNDSIVTTREERLRRIFKNDDLLEQIGPAELKRMLKIKEKLFEVPEEDHEHDKQGKLYRTEPLSFLLNAGSAIGIRTPSNNTAPKGN